MKYSIVIPCFNEQGTIKLILERTKNPFIENIYPSITKTMIIKVVKNKNKNSKFVTTS